MLCVNALGDGVDIARVLSRAWQRVPLGSLAPLPLAWVGELCWAHFLSAWLISVFSPQISITPNAG